ncbi:MAG: hypothetical protein RLY85_2344 [Bacteroidota bacterium]|jgi:mono/diheme cytochrome c family protein
MKRNLILIAITVFSASCFYDKADLVYPVASTCDTTAVKYSTTIAPVLTASCNGCHGGTAAAGAGIVLDNYNSVKTWVTNGKLLNSMLQNGKASAMPKGGGKLDNCTLNKISSWINQGALNN